jgi:hypothetical protein
MAFDPESRLQLTVSNKSGGLGDNFVTKIATIPNGKHFFGTYGGGLYQSKVDLRLHSRRLRDREATPVQVDEADESYLPKFPTPPKPLTLDQLNAMESKLEQLQKPLPVPYASYFGEDWKTQGDWTGRIYREWAIACATESPFDDYFFHSNKYYDVKSSIGPNHPGQRDSIRLYNRGNNTNAKTLWNQLNGVRRQGEWDDHGEVYPWHIDGPDIWYLLEIKHKGTFRISMYFVNPDGHGGNNRMRDYLIEFYPTDMIWESSRSRYDTEKKERVTYFDLTPEIGRNGEKLARKIPPLVRSRVHDFWGGVHVQFVVTGPHNYLVKVDRNYSFNTIMSSVTVDQIFGEPTHHVKRKFGISDIPIPYEPPLFPEFYRQKEGRQIYDNWKKLDHAFGFEDGIELQRINRILLYQSANAMSKENEKDKLLLRLSKTIKWRLNQWDDEQRKEWNETVQQAWKKLYDSNESIRKAADESKSGNAIKNPRKDRIRILYD